MRKSEIYNEGTVVRARGQAWAIAGEISRTSDGFAIAMGALIDESTGDLVLDEDGQEIYHSLFLGYADDDNE